MHRFDFAIAATQFPHNYKAKFPDIDSKKRERIAIFQSHSPSTNHAHRHHQKEQWTLWRDSLRDETPTPSTHPPPKHDRGTVESRRKWHEQAEWLVAAVLRGKMAESAANN